jgi:hypothetical protein
VDYSRCNITDRTVQIGVPIKLDPASNPAIPDRRLATATPPP